LLCPISSITGRTFRIKDIHSDAVNCGYFTCWYARQLVTNQSIQCFSGDYGVAVQDIREDIMCSIIDREIVIGDDKRKKKKLIMS
jgi:CxxC motif-containing protein (DUF1111 family)